jgi:hypothetical protein
MNGNLSHIELPEFATLSDRLSGRVHRMDDPFEKPSFDRFSPKPVGNANNQRD